MASAPSSASRSSESASASARGSGSAQPTADVTAVTTRDDFLLEIGQTLDGQAAVRPVETVDAALELVSSGKRAQVLVIDSRGLADVRAAVDAAAMRAPRAVIVVFAEDAAEKQLAATLKDSKVFAVLATPIDLRKTQAVLEGAIAESAAHKAATPRAAAPAPAELSIGSFRGNAAPARPDSAGAGTPRGANKTLLVAAAIAALAVLAGGTWYFMHGGASRPAAAAANVAAPAHATTAQPVEEAAPEQAVADTSIVQGRIDDLLEKARLAMHERRYTEPNGDNALLYYRSAAAADANNGEAKDGLLRVASVLAGRFEDALNAGRYEEAGQTLANFKSAAPGDSRVASFEQRLFAAEISKSLADGNLDRAAAYVRQAQQSGSAPPEQLAKWRAEIAHRTDDTKVTRLAGLVSDRIRDGRLLDGEDSAKAYLQQLQATAPANATTQRAAHDLGVAFLHKARDAGLARNNAEQERWIGEARAVGLKPAEIAAFQRDLSNTRQKAAQAETDRLLQLARDRMHDGRLSDPAQDSAVFYLAQVESSDPTNAALMDASHELAQKFEERARSSATAGKSADADLAQAKRWGADPKELAAIQQLQSAPKSSAIDTAALAASLRRTRSPAPDYPESALAQHIAGSVLVQYTVDVNGETRDIKVLESSPPGVFDRAATNAIRRWRYAPMLVNGTAVQVPTKTLLRFELPK
ncbi:MAG: TonB family protein [Proteobacteria bacterium]|nr:TonB family protein [Pseudomonadota bacterium]